MGDWFERTLEPGDIPCGEIKSRNKLGTNDLPVLWNSGPLGEYVKRNTDWRTNAYLKHLHATMMGHDSSDGDRAAIMILGDSHSRSDRIPALAKSRFSQFALPRQGDAPFFSTIIWPLSIERHYDAVDEYLWLEKAGKVVEWEDKKAALIWRGGATGIKNDKTLVRDYPDGGWRIQVVKKYFGGDVSDVDIAFKTEDDTLKYAKKYQVGNLVRSSHTSMEDQLRFKYVLAIEGNDVATGLKWQLASNSVVFMARPTCVTYAMEDLLVPYVHYVPLEDDYSNVVEMVRWARENDHECRRISERATEFMDRLWVSEEARRDHEFIRRELGEAYHRQFGEAIKSCPSPPIPASTIREVPPVDPKLAKDVESAVDAAGLRDTCHGTTSGDYSYTVCLLGKSTQRLKDEPDSEGTDLGSWHGPSVDGEEHKNLQWEGGETKYCPHKVPRSAEARVSCGEETRVTAVGEPTTCHYVFTMESPIGCVHWEPRKTKSNWTS